MGPTIIARNYAETLLTLAQGEGGDRAVDAYGSALDEVAELLRQEPRIREFLETPRVSTDERKRAIRGTFEGRVPEPFLRFLLVVVDKRRQTCSPRSRASIAISSTSCAAGCEPTSRWRVTATRASATRSSPRWRSGSAGR
jgi:F0F1-type ATP synthase delta subunit